MARQCSTEIQRNPTLILKVVLRDERGAPVGRASLVIIVNESNVRPYGLLEDVFVSEELRGQGLGTQLVEKIVQLAREERCYKLIATSRYSRPRVHELYKTLGFQDHGREFRMDFPA
jgi:GNAT superfamily N-acetyltransferase